MRGGLVACGSKTVTQFSQDIRWWCQRKTFLNAHTAHRHSLQGGWWLGYGSCSDLVYTTFQSKLISRTVHDYPVIQRVGSNVVKHVLFMQKGNQNLYCLLAQQGSSPASIPSSARLPREETTNIFHDSSYKEPIFRPSHWKKTGRYVEPGTVSVCSRIVWKSYSQTRQGPFVTTYLAKAEKTLPPSGSRVIFFHPHSNLSLMSMPRFNYTFLSHV